jgi:hypothetical protein
MDRFARAVALVAGITTLGLGVWAFFAPASFYENVASFPPYNRHLIHDAGAFLFAIGATLLFALRFADGLLAALGGAAAGMLLHGVSHIEDRALGGRSTDPYTLSIAGLILLAGAIARARSPRA